MAPGLSGNEVRVAPGVKIVVAPVATAAPVDEAVAYGAGWIDVGYAQVDGVRLRVNDEKQEIEAWQAVYPVRRISIRKVVGIGFQLLQWNKDTLPLALGGGTVSLVSAGHWKYAPPSPSAAPDEKALGIDWKDGTNIYRAIFPKVMLTDQVEIPLTRREPAGLPLAFGLNAPETGDAFYILTNDPAFT